jgi:glycosyltransferase involved in cell wall biosynthesis
MNVFVILATRGREELLERTLASLAQCRIPEGFRGTLVVENGARGHAERVVRQAAAILAGRYSFEPIGNKSRALNAALKQIDEGLVVFLDDDVRVGPDLLEMYARAGRRVGPGHFLGGPIAPDYEEPPPSWLVEFLPPSAKGWTPDDHSDFETTAPFFMGCNWAAFAEDLHRVGGFSEHFGPGSLTGSVGQESQMQRRLAAAGVVATYVPEVLVHHWVPRDRCSREFGLDRAYREGIRRGLLRQKGLDSFTAGYPIVLVKRAIEHWLRWQIQRLGSDRRARFAAEFKYRRQKGVIKGVMLNRGAGGRRGSSARET